MKIKSLICILALLLCSFFAFSALPSFVDESYEAFYLDDDYEDNGFANSSSSSDVKKVFEIKGKAISKESRSKIKRAFNNLYEHQKIAGEYSTNLQLPASITGGVMGLDYIGGKFAVIDFANALVDFNAEFNVLGIPFDFYLHTIGVDLHTSKIYKNYSIDKSGNISFSNELLKNKEMLLGSDYSVPKVPFFTEPSAYDALGLGLALSYFEEVGDNKYSCVFTIDEDYDDIEDISDLLGALTLYKPSKSSQLYNDEYGILTFTIKDDEIDTVSLQLCNIDKDGELAEMGIGDCLMLKLNFTAFDSKALSKNGAGEYTYLPRNGGRAR